MWGHIQKSVRLILLQQYTWSLWTILVSDWLKLGNYRFKWFYDFNKWLWKENLISNGQQFQKYQPSEQPALISTTEHKKRNHDLWWWESRSCLVTGTTMCWVIAVNGTPPPLGSWNYNDNADTNKQLKACTVVSDAKFFVAVCSIKKGLN